MTLGGFVKFKYFGSSSKESCVGGRKRKGRAG